MHALLLIAAMAGSPAASSCVTHECVPGEECWEVVITYHEAISAPGAPHQTVTRQVISGGWGDITGARCLVDYVSHEGLWLEGQLYKVPASALEAPLRIRPVTEAAEYAR